jgi:N-acetyl-gamma-glutamyl-phosphate reductase/acetylglutamate kinase
VCSRGPSTTAHDPQLSPFIFANSLQQELFTDSGAGTLIRRGYKLFKHGSMDSVGADRIRQIIHDRDPDVAAELAIVPGMLADLVESPYTPFGDQRSAACIATTKLLPSRQALLAGVPDNVFDGVKKEHSRLSTSTPKRPSRTGISARRMFSG